MDLSAIAMTLFQAKKSKSLVPSFENAGVQLTLDDAYRVQSELLRLDSERGEKLIGFKMGLTSKAKQQDVGVHEAIMGYLTSSMLTSLRIDAFKCVQPRIEPEVVVRLGGPIDARSSRAEILKNISFLGLGVEVLDSRYKNFKFALGDVIADNASASAFVVGAKNCVEFLSELNEAPVTIQQHDRVLQQGAPSAVLGDPIKSIEELTRLIEKYQMPSLQQGHWILTGGMTASVSIAAGQRFTVSWPWESLELVVE